MLAEKITDQSEWDALVASHDGHPLQLWGWGSVKSTNGWRATRIAVKDESGDVRGGAQVLEKPIPLIGKTLAYVPRGPWCAESDRAAILESLRDYVQTHFAAISLTIEPDWETRTGLEDWEHSSGHILIGDTLRLDLTKSIDDLLSVIPSKRRYDIRTSTKKLTSLRRLTDPDELDAIIELYHDTAARAGFGVHNDAYYRTIHEQLADGSVILVAYEDTTPVAFTWYAVTPYIAFELYSGISERGQRLRANYGLRWYGIEYFHHQNVKIYDFNGLLNDGISTFKRSFADHENKLVGTYVYQLSPWHTIWTVLEPLAKHVARLVAKVR